MTKFTKFAVVAAFAFIALAGVKASAYVTVPPNLMQGSMGAQVMNLQSALGITADGNFGSGTKAAVMSFQASHGLGSDGVVGPKTAAALNAMGTTTGTYPAGCTSNTGFSMTTGESCAATTTTMPAGCVAGAMFSATTGEPCTGGNDDGGSTFDGTLSGEGDPDNNVDVNDADDTDLQEGQSGAELGSFEFETKDGDVMIDRVDVVFYPKVGNDEMDPWNVFDNVSIEVDGDTIADMDSSSKGDWDETNTTDDVYRLRFSGLDLVAQEDEKVTITVVADLSNSIDGTSDGETWDIAFSSDYPYVADGIRFEDAGGFVDTFGDTSTASFDINDAGADDALDVNTDSENPDAMTLEVGTTSSKTYDVLAAEFEADKDGGDLQINDITIAVTVTDPAAGLTPTLDDMISEVYLEINGDTFSSDSSSSTSDTMNASSDTGYYNFSFDDEDFTIDSGDTSTVTVSVKFKSKNSNYDEGTTLYASVTTADSADTGSTDDVTAEGVESGDDVTDTDGSVTGEIMTLNTEGISASLNSVSSSENTDNNGDTTKVTYTVKFDVTAIGTSVYIPTSVAAQSAASAAAGSNGLNYEVETSADATVAAVDILGSASSITSTTGANLVSGRYEVTSGNTETFEVEISLDAPIGSGATLPGYFRVQLLDLGYSTTSGGTVLNFDLNPESDFDSSDKQIDVI